MVVPEIVSRSARTLCDESRSTRRLPLNFRDADLELFQHELSVSIPTARLLELNRVTVGSAGIIFGAGRILAESFNYRHEFIRWANPRNLLKFFVRNYALKIRRRLDNRALWIIDSWGGAYFHWLLDALPRLYVVRDQLANSTLLLPESFKELSYILPSLAPFGVREIRFIGHDEILYCRKLLVPTHLAPSGQYNERVIRGLRELYRNYYRQGAISHLQDKVYISRSKAGKRRIVNEKEVIETLREHGFSVFVLEDYAFEDQVKIVLNARYVVANHGAGLANILFLPEKSHVLELRKLGDSHNNCYFALASGLNLKYYYQLCEAEDPEVDAGLANIYVEPNCLRTNLTKMLSQESI
jgi:hypothetical protein